MTIGTEPPAAALTAIYKLRHNIITDAASCCRVKKIIIIMLGFTPEEQRKVWS